jgi:hypothetical protein
MSQTTAPIAGKIGQALKFDGLNDFVECGTNSSVLPDTFTFSAWAKVKQPSTASTLIGWSSATAFPSLILNLNPSQHIIYLGANNYRYFSATSPHNVSDDKWHHYAFIVTGNNQSDIDNSVLYVDGKAQGVISTLSSAPPSGKTLCRLGSSGQLPFNGIIDDARLYNHAFSPSEVLQLYTSGR